MKLTVSTPTRTITRYTPLGALSDRAALFIDRFHSLFQIPAGGFSFGIFGPVGAFQPKEVVIENKGHQSLGSKSQFNFFKKEF